MFLSQQTLDKVNKDLLDLPNGSVFELPEKVLQFGTGVLLRGLPDYFIDKANRQGVFNGRVVVVKSTSTGSAEAFDQQDCLYTTCIRGIESGDIKEEYLINSSISRVLSAQSDWYDILKCAHDPEMRIIISNTTELGIELVSELINQTPPASFPGKLLAFLYERYKAFKGTISSGMVIVPTELIPDNGKRLEAIVLELAHLNGLEPSFIDWIEECNVFCNSLVDRIVPGKPAKAEKEKIETQLGYEDDLMIVAEPYALWAIEGNEHVRKVLAFVEADQRVVICNDIDKFRELKLRLLNGTHTMTCGLAYLSGCVTVSDAMQNEQLAAFIKGVMQHEIGPSIPYPVETEAVQDFSNKLIDRFSNSFIKHNWISITAQYSSKIKQRIVPLLVQHYKKSTDAPELMTLGVAAFLLFMKPVRKTDNAFYGNHNGEEYLINDVHARRFYDSWKLQSVTKTVEKILADNDFWETDLNQLPGFTAAVSAKLEELITHGPVKTLENTSLMKMA